jgi:hypothetical protein
VTAEPSRSAEVVASPTTSAWKVPLVGRVLGRATRWTIRRPDMWPVALAAFLARGGVLVILLPFLVLPTPIGLASFIGADAITAAGPTARFIVIAVAVGLLAAGLVLAGSVVAAAADRVVLRGWTEDAAPARPSTEHRPVATVARILAVRIVAAIPRILAIAWAVPRIADATYRQLTLPDDLATPIVLRVAAMAPEAIALVVVGLLAGELIAGLATVHVVVEGRGAARSLLLVGRDLVRRPVPVLGAFAIGIVAVVAGIGLPVAAGIAAWGLVRQTLADGAGPFLALASAFSFAASIVAALALAGMIAAWRRISLAEALAEQA